MALKMQSMLPKEVERGFYIPSLSDGMEEKCVVQEWSKPNIQFEKISK